jgi:GntR family transcriptional repressor for pyruvate dehydrogenase complex
VQGLVQIRTGRAGGAFVQKPGEESIASSVNLMIRGRHIRMAALLETREAVEPSCAQLAARYRTSADLDRLERANEAIATEGSLSDFLTANIDWHIAVSVASHIYDSTDNQGFIDAEVRRTTVHAHKSITDAIRDQDPEAAVRRMKRHVHEYAEAVLEVEDRTAIEVGET